MSNNDAEPEVSGAKVPPAPPNPFTAEDLRALPPPRAPRVSTPASLSNRLTTKAKVGIGVGVALAVALFGFLFITAFGPEPFTAKVTNTVWNGPGTQTSQTDVSTDFIMDTSVDIEYELHNTSAKTITVTCNPTVNTGSMSWGNIGSGEQHLLAPHETITVADSITGIGATEGKVELNCSRTSNPYGVTN